MYLTRRFWLAYTAVTLGLFGASLFFALADGPWAIWEFLVGAAWAFNLGRWASTRTDRRRGWRVIARPAKDGMVDVVVIGRDMDAS